MRSCAHHIHSLGSKDTPPWRWKTTSHAPLPPGAPSRAPAFTTAALLHPQAPHSGAAVTLEDASAARAARAPPAPSTHTPAPQPRAGAHGHATDEYPRDDGLPVLPMLPVLPVLPRAAPRPTPPHLPYPHPHARPTAPVLLRHSSRVRSCPVPPHRRLGASCTSSTGAPAPDRRGYAVERRLARGGRDADSTGSAWWGVSCKLYADARKGGGAPTLQVRVRCAPPSSHVSDSRTPRVAARVCAPAFQMRICLSTGSVARVADKTGVCMHVRYGYGSCIAPNQTE
ncbi:hypothetical protein FB451DRAFT_1440569 [Mycena latifolia]|nr:hypothetical protein FB451DRAFT_1440569 [Mycena latifolia]